MNRHSMCHASGLYGDELIRKKKDMVATKAWGLAKHNAERCSLRKRAKKGGATGREGEREREKEM